MVLLLFQKYQEFTGNIIKNNNHNAYKDLYQIAIQRKMIHKEPNCTRFKKSRSQTAAKEFQEFRNDKTNGPIRTAKNKWFIRKEGKHNRNKPGNDVAYGRRY